MVAPQNTQNQFQVLLFAGARAAVGRSSLTIELPDRATAGDALARIGDAAPELSRLLASCRLAVNQEFVDASAIVPLRAELALIPPVSGG
jgi:molybdopterin converting factor subunit 1